MSAADRPVGHEAVLERLESFARSVAAGNDDLLHHAHLMAGPAGVGKFRVALWWASLLKCRQAGGCGGSCESCRLVNAGVHPDLELIEVSADSKAGVIGIGQIRGDRERRIPGLIQRMALKPLQPGPRIAIIRDAHAMTPEAQNSALKLLEEPPGFAVIVLVADNVSALLPTVRSRCQLLRFGALSEEELARILAEDGRTREEATAAAAIARGSAARALDYDAEGLAEREELLLGFEQARHDREALEPFVLELAGLKAKGYGLGEILQWQLEKVEAGLGGKVSEGSERLREILDGLSANDIERLVDDAGRIHRTIAMLDRNANAKIALRDLLLNMGH